MSDRSPLETPQHLLDKSVVGSDDDKWLIYEVEEKAQHHHDVKLILLRNVDDYGVKGQVGFNPSTLSRLLFHHLPIYKSYISGGKCPLSPRSCKVAPPRLR